MKRAGHKELSATTLLTGAAWRGPRQRPGRAGGLPGRREGRGSRRPCSVARSPPSASRICSAFQTNENGFGRGRCCDTAVKPLGRTPHAESERPSLNPSSTASPASCGCTRWGVTARVLGSLPSLWEAPSFSLAPARLLKAFGEQTSRGKLSCSLSHSFK